jgi:hypothetical protein
MDEDIPDQDATQVTTKTDLTDEDLVFIILARS